MKHILLGDVIHPISNKKSANMENPLNVSKYSSRNYLNSNKMAQPKVQSKKAATKTTGNVLTRTALVQKLKANPNRRMTVNWLTQDRSPHTLVGKHMGQITEGGYIQFTNENKEIKLVDPRTINSLKIGRSTWTAKTQAK